MISLKKITNWQSKRYKDSGNYVWDQDVIDHRIYNDLPIDEKEDDLVKDYTKIDLYKKRQNPEER